MHTRLEDSISEETTPCIGSLEIIQLLFLLNYYKLRSDVYKQNGICYGYAYANAYALADDNHQIIKDRANLLTDLYLEALRITEINLKNSDLLLAYEKCDESIKNTA